jgi:hypothetical protein
MHQIISNKPKTHLTLTNYSSSHSYRYIKNYIYIVYGVYARLSQRFLIKATISPIMESVEQSGLAIDYHMLHVVFYVYREYHSPISRHLFTSCPSGEVCIWWVPHSSRTPFELGDVVRRSAVLLQMTFILIKF